MSLCVRQTYEYLKICDEEPRNNVDVDALLLEYGVIKAKTDEKESEDERNEKLAILAKWSIPPENR